MNNYKTIGMFHNSGSGSSIANTPIPLNSFSLFIEKTGAYSYGCKQTITYFATGETWIRVSNVNSAGDWGSWRKIAFTN